MKAFSLCQQANNRRNDCIDSHPNPAGHDSF